MEGIQFWIDNALLYVICDILHLYFKLVGGFVPIPSIAYGKISFKNFSLWSEVIKKIEMKKSK